VQPLVGVLHRLHEVAPAGLARVGGYPLDQRAVLGKQLVHRRRDHVGLELGEAGQAGKIQKRVHRHSGQSWEGDVHCDATGVYQPPAASRQPPAASRQHSSIE
jgi:hypothetical protein